ncbi:hypothetical protein D3C79_558410 [compost metagenome]
MARVLSDGQQRQDQSGNDEGQHRVLEVAQLPQPAAGDVVGQEHVDIQVHRLAQGIGNRGLAQVQQPHQQQAGGQQLVGPQAAETQRIALLAQHQCGGEQHAQGQDALMVQLDQVVDHAKAGHLSGRRRNDEQQQEEQRHGVALAAPGR